MRRTRYATFVVGAIVSDFPMLYPTHASGGFILAYSADYFAAIVNVLADAQAADANDGWLYEYHATQIRPSWGRTSFGCAANGNASA